MGIQRPTIPGAKGADVQYNTGGTNDYSGSGPYTVSETEEYDVSEHKHLTREEILTLTQEEMEKLSPEDAKNYFLELIGEQTLYYDIIKNMDPEEAKKKLWERITNAKEAAIKANEAKQTEFYKNYSMLYAVRLLEGQNLTDEEKKNVLLEHGYSKADAEEAVKYYNVSTDVIRGKYGSGNARKEALEKAGYDYSLVQNMVNRNQVIDVDLIHTETSGDIKYNDMITNLDSLKNYSKLVSTGEADSKNGRYSSDDISKVANSMIEEGKALTTIVDAVDDSAFASKVYKYFAQENPDENFNDFMTINKFTPEQRKQAAKISTFLDSLEESNRKKLLFNFKS